MDKNRNKRLCPRCKHLTKQALSIHLKKCSLCPRCRTYKTDLKGHLATCKGALAVARVKCPLCPLTYHPRSLTKHLKKEHSRDIWIAGNGAGDVMSDSKKPNKGTVHTDQVLVSSSGFVKIALIICNY